MPSILDTNIFNRLVDGKIDLDNLPVDGEFIATYVQIFEINQTKDAARRGSLLLRFAEVRPRLVPTESLVWGVTPWGQGKWGAGDVYVNLRGDLDARNKGKANNIQDALIGEVALVNSYTLITEDRDLADVMRSNGAHVIQLGT